MKRRLRGDWYFGFFGLFALFAVPYLQEGIWPGIVWVVWIVWFLYFIPVREKRNGKSK